jgi:hypothetical protein
MRVRICPFVIALLCSLGCSSGPRSGGHEGRGLLQFADRDLRQLSEHEQKNLARAFKGATGEELQPPSDIDDPEPWWVKEFTGGGACWMFLEVNPERMVPGISSVRAQFFDAQWHRVAKDEFPTGYRSFLKEANIVRDNPLGEELLQVTIESAGPFVVVNGKEKGPAFAAGMYEREYYAYRGGHMLLVRLETSKGELVTASYRWAAPDKGPAPQWANSADCLKSLQSQDQAEQLAVLVWLAGAHLNSNDPRYTNTSQEDVKASALVESVCDDPAARAAVKRLRESTNIWIREYASDIGN